jgi:hypothetical protein
MILLDFKFIADVHSISFLTNRGIASDRYYCMMILSQFVMELPLFCYCLAINYLPHDVDLLGTVRTLCWILAAFCTFLPMCCGKCAKMSFVFLLRHAVPVCMGAAGQCGRGII